MCMTQRKAGRLHDPHDALYPYLRSALCLVPESSWCRLLRLLKLLQQLFVMSLTAPQTRVPLINKALPVWLSYLGQLAYIVGLFLNFLACLWLVHDTSQIYHAVV